MNFISAINAIYSRLDKDTKDILEELNDKIYNKMDTNAFNIKVNDIVQRKLVFNYLKLLGYNVSYNKNYLYIDLVSY